MSDTGPDIGPDIVLETERLVLRQIEPGDAALQYRLLNTPAVMEHLGGPKELHEIEAKHAKSMASFAAEGFGFMMAMDKATGDLVGHCGLKRVDNPLAKNTGDHEIGWLVREDRWGQGLAGEAARAVLDWAFERHDARLVAALTGKRNIASWRIMERLGMERREDLDFDDPAYPLRDRTTILYSIKKSQWEKQK